MSEALHIKYRPQVLEDVIGQEPVVKNLARLFETGRVPHTFLFTGPSGTGKTTLARIVAAKLGAGDFASGLFEVDAARYSGIEQMRELLSNLRYVGIGESTTRFVVVDEAHALSRATWQTLLLATEEPPEHLYWAFCTTEPDKVPTTIRTRAHAYDLKPVPWDSLAEFMEAIREEEKLKVKKEFVDLAARKANGSVRQALVFLSLLDGIIEKRDALRVIEEVDAEGDGAISLARMIVSGRGFSWDAAVKLIESMSDASPESIRIAILNYSTAALMKAKGDKEVVKLLAVVEMFSKPWAPGERLAPLLLAVGSLLYA